MSITAHFLFKKSHRTRQALKKLIGGGGLAVKVSKKFTMIGNDLKKSPPAASERVSKRLTPGLIESLRCKKHHVKVTEFEGRRERRGPKNTM